MWFSRNTPKYKLLGSGSAKDVESFTSTHETMKKSTHVPLSTSSVLAIVLSLIIALQSFFLIKYYKQVSLSCISPNRFRLQRTVERTSYLPSVFSSHNETEASQAWQSINAGLGIVVVNSDYATQQDLPDTLAWPGHNNKTQLIYVLESYHVMHCVRIIRIHYIAFLEAKPLDWPVKHDLHCFNALREYIMCNPDDSLMFTTGHQDVGKGQKKMCGDWDSLRDWATAHYADYFDHEVGDGEKHWNNHHEGDGLPVGSLS